MRFCDNLKNLRIANKMTQIELAKALNTSQSSITAWENQTREPDFDTIRKIAEYFNVTMASLLPSDDTIDESFGNSIASVMVNRPKLYQIFETAKFLPDSDLDTILSVANSLGQKRQ